MKKKYEIGAAGREQKNLSPARPGSAQLGLSWLRVRSACPGLVSSGWGPGSGSARLGLAKLVVAVSGLSGSARFEQKSG